MRVQKEANGKTVVRVSVTGRMAQLMAGEISVRDLDDEELARGQCRNENGKFPTWKPEVVPREFQDEMIRRLLERGGELWRTGYLWAIRTHLEICTDLNVDPNTRLKAAQYIIERTAGKTPDTLIIKPEDVVEVLFRKMLLDPDGLEAPVIDAEVVEDGAAVG